MTTSENKTITDHDRVNEAIKILNKLIPISTYSVLETQQDCYKVLDLLIVESGISANSIPLRKILVNKMDVARAHNWITREKYEYYNDQLIAKFLEHTLKENP
uniref:Uncharacterized protein n=1 Tax=Pithovirus LCPAC403 TaxID=2506596 RepID=A0A481ZBE8_9VIRU|nr:MAG: hypothetical protein LCPAC403_02310 [Pithovirus LCPAC403]